MASILLNTKLRHNPTYLLVLNLAFADISISIFVHTFTDVGIILGRDYFEANSHFCKFLGAVCLITCAASLVTMCVLALNR